jgi:hypothetical protein
MPRLGSDPTNKMGNGMDIQEPRAEGEKDRNLEECKQLLTYEIREAQKW